MKKIIHALAQQHHDHVIQLRRYFHSYPELSFQEYNTQQKIMKELSAIGLSPLPLAGTGVIVDIHGNHPGKTVAIRADIDALPLQDSLDKPYISKNAGVCHACGHDGHTAALLGIAKILHTIKDDLCGTIRLLFQPAEEKIPGGAITMIEQGALNNVDVIIGAHLWQPLPVGSAGITPGAVMAAGDRFEITVTGRGGHGSMPHQTIDPLLTAANLVVELNHIVSRNIDPLESAAVSIGTFHAGNAFNIIPGNAVLQGTVRTFSQITRTTIFERIEQITAGICSASGAVYSLTKELGYPPLINNPDVAAVLLTTARQYLGDQAALPIKPITVSEDFAYYLEKVAGAFIFIGAGNQPDGISYPHHHEQFDIDETSLRYAMEILSLAAIKLAVPS